MRHAGRTSKGVGCWQYPCREDIRLWLLEPEQADRPTFTAWLSDSFAEHCSADPDDVICWDSWVRRSDTLTSILEDAIGLARESAPDRLPALEAVRDGCVWAQFLLAVAAPPSNYRAAPCDGDTVPLAEFSRLPNVPGVYAAHRHGRTLYVGASRRMLRRWCGGHHRMPELVRAGEDARLSWLVLPEPRIGLAEECVAAVLCPSLNSRRHRRYDGRGADE
jgi:hypothetical protein